MTHEDEYHDSMVQMLELIWGEGYMAPGGPGNVARILRDIDTEGKRILDIGCGIGGPGMEMVQTHGARVTGVDLEASLIRRAQASAEGKGLADRCRFQVVTPGTLPFDDGSFDIVISSGAVTQTPDQAAMFADIFRLLTPGGWFSCYEWLRTDAEYSDEMLYWFKLEGLTYEMRTFDQYRELLLAAGFNPVTTEDATHWYQAEAHRELELLKGPEYTRMVELLGQEDADYFIEDWRAMTVVIDNGEMKQGYLRGQKPAAL